MCGWRGGPKSSRAVLFCSFRVLACPCRRLRTTPARERDCPAGFSSLSWMRACEVVDDHALVRRALAQFAFVHRDDDDLTPTGIDEETVGGTAACESRSRDHEGRNEQKGFDEPHNKASLGRTKVSTAALAKVYVEMRGHNSL